ncbi:serine/threonine protein kinase [Lentzea guizhouensis]|uniref:serine/threonine protein kinase n=1 Tax=Lentzea guizhouensis TaxID=1586287 RepID=UPI0012B68339|nr:serine/threonine protein kinase [Lentzea guizhouensis]
MSRADTTPGGKSLLICLDDQAGGRPPVVEVANGDSVTFGRRERDGTLVIGCDATSAAGRIHAFEDYWLLANSSTSNTYCVENLEGVGEYVKVQAGRGEVPIPFELSRVMLAAGGGHNSFTVFAPERPDTGVVPGSDDALPLLDEESRYFMVLVCLCEPRLRRGGAAAVPTPAQVSQRLSRFGDERALGRSAVNYHIDYLAGKFGPVAPAGMTRAAKRESLVASALKFDLVRPEHLSLMPAAPTAARAAGAPATTSAPARTEHR